MSRIAAVEARWGMPFWDLVADLHAQDLSQRDAGRALGYETKNQYIAFHQLLGRNLRNPWKTRRSVPAQYTIDTGEPFKDAVVRLAKTHTLAEAARAIGYASGNPLQYALRVRGIDVQFQHRWAKTRSTTV